jgi:hypothetical protein
MRVHFVENDRASLFYNGTGFSLERFRIKH